MIFSSFLYSSTDVAAEGEPAEEFLKRLRAAGYYDMADAYLDRLQKTPGVAPSFLSAIPLEKAQTSIDAAIASRSRNQQDQAFEKAEAELQAYVDANSSHERASEARSMLGKLQMVRAAQHMSGELDSAKRSKARETYAKAAKTFENIQADLKTKLEGMQGAKIDPVKDPEKASLRDQYRFEYLIARQNTGEAQMMGAKTFEDPSKDGQGLLEKALAEMVELSEKYEKYIIGASAFHKRGDIERLLGRKDKAIESYTRMLEQQDADPLREPKIGATIGLIKLALAEDPPNYKDAIKQGEEFEKTLRPNEKRLPITQELRIELAKAFVAKSKDEKDTKPNERKRATSDARQLLLSARKVDGPHTEETKALLADLGVQSSDETVELPTADDPANFDEAFKSANQLVQTSQLLNDQLRKLQSDKAPADQIKEVEASLINARQTGVIILRRGLSMIDSESDTMQVNEARKFLTYLLQQEDYFRDSFVSGRFLAQNAPGTDAGLVGGVLALGSAQKLITQSGDREAEYWLKELQSVGDYLIRIWPDDPKAAAAQDIMVRLALSNDDFDASRKLIDEMADGPQKFMLARLLGQTLWNDSIRLLSEEKPDESKSQMKAAAKELQKGLDGISGGLVSTEAFQAALTLAKIHVRTDAPAKAVKTLDHPKYGPVKNRSKMDQPSASMISDLYRTELQAVVGLMTTSNDGTDKLLDRAAGAIDELRSNSQGADGEKRLVSTFVSLANDIRQQLDTAPPAKKAKLVDAFQVFLTRIADSTDDKATLQWVGQTLMELGEASMTPGKKKADGQAAALLKSAADTFTNLKDPSEDGLANRFLLGKTQRLRGEYSSALNELESVLKQKSMMLDAQKEAALTYEQWASELDPKFAGRAYKSALSGGRPGPDKKNTIWGWGRISQLTQRNEQFREIFFESRYHVALCRYLRGKAMNSDAIIEQSIRDITGLVVLYPEMGGEEQKRKFNALLKQIQQAAGQPATGLK
ncbi:hypothetical protein [Rhodopirellula bahusiensis]|uniref:Uncharacterized protein n=1 Tax=Rhodopirellula bahusiensis TaxID=2014065 RepID=A0A2G1WE47_9BACT|nr:hypothetical protein [Rhodopirellula bahusiensis]PHQ37332.1 hypothetical protein CEE69_02290 [Rhodopirellula bahusiensis]